MRHKVISQSATGRVEIVKSDDVEGKSEWVDLATEEFRWLYPLREEEEHGAAAPRRRLRGKTAEG